MAKYIPNSFFDKIFLRLGKKAKLNHLVPTCFFVDFESMNRKLKFVL